ncbi:MAG: Ppx/GppA family phosphatase [Actinomycetia bacterium]|nr:Ppx/GppA family phosphatase [Actinomycetes bacterium]MCP4961247.1 Ppx/GppA family phosphatase [Actinomycetes bacterium]
MMSSERRAAIDCGSNTTRLLITEAGRDLVRESHITGLGKGLATTGRMSQEAIDRCVAVLGQYRDRIDLHEVTAIRAIATSASRDADNAVEFFDAAEFALGIRPEVISGSNEAALGFAGATGGLSSTGSVMVVDIGGGSTEFSVGNVVDGAGTLSDAISINMGSVRFTDTYLQHDPPQPEELTSLLSMVEAHLDDVIRTVPGAGSVSTVVAVAGTATTVAAVEIGLLEYDSEAIEGFILSRSAAEDVFRTLATEPLADRIHNPGLPRGRADLIVAGCAILVGVMRFFDLDEVVIREHDILDGLVESIDPSPGGVGLGG